MPRPYRLTVFAIVANTVSLTAPGQAQDTRKEIETVNPDDEVQEFPWGKFLFFTDPDGNGWSVQLPIR